MNAYGMGGTIRTTLNLVEELAETHDVELISVIRRRAQPLFEFPDGHRGAARLTTAAERRSPQNPLGLGARVLRRMPSLLVHPEDWAFAASNAWSDLLLIRKLRSLDGRRADHDAARVQRDRGEARARARGDGRPGAPQLQRPPARGSRARSSGTTRSSTRSSC